ncbi:C6 transcription factor [Penicillium malachiteum]|uniref:C6 transcription factor n=1 Tax=Penicillium malachiteum TaxID=1324776 RepID=A0AAD6HJ96_9EURO|nr:C6 transcription factor [Penicillium malachiteum]
MSDGHPESVSIGYKTRRSHRKSRHGCKKCKDRRIKCDELKPKCSRCSTLGLACHYSSKIASSSAPPTIPPQVRDLQSFVQSESICKLNAQEYALFKHYIEHTSRDLTVDSQEQFTLQIGIPILAFQSRALMSSILALSAVCKCSDIIKQLGSVQHPEARENIIEMLNIADQYHMESLRKIQVALPEIRQYDHVLANAAMMGMYGSGSHCIRIWLSETSDSEASRKKFNPGGAQWTRLFRAVRMAYTGLLRNSNGSDDSIPEQTSPFPLEFSISGNDLKSSYEHCASSVAKPSRSMSNHFMYPTIAATIQLALGSLIERVDHFLQLEFEGITQAKEGNLPDLQACQISLEILKKIVLETFCMGLRLPDSGTPQNRSLHLSQQTTNVDELGQLLDIAPWLHRYTASITSILPSKLPRRFIMAFIHKVPTQFLTLVEGIMGLIHTETTDPSSSAMVYPTISFAHQLALDIFAHWLVLVTLVSDVWWIGNIGIWELKHIISFTQRLRDQMNVWGKNEDWWPKSMLHVAEELSKFT